MAVECFHKASLVHDDIEDDDALRYGEKTLHEEHGVPVALNVGDLADGRRLSPAGRVRRAARQVRVRDAADRRRGPPHALPRPGGRAWLGARPQPLSSLEVLEIFRQKTAPAFEVALATRRRVCRAPTKTSIEVLTRYSEALGIAYQIRDDLEDLGGDQEPDDLTAMRPSLPLAVAYERPKVPHASCWKASGGAPRAAAEAAEARAIIRDSGAEDRCRGLLESYKEEAVRSLAELENASLKGLLRRVVGKIFSVEVKGWCSEFEARNAAGRQAGAEAAG